MNLGAVERKYDPRDYKLTKLSKLLGSAIPIPEELPFNEVTADQNYQASWPACGAHTGSHLVEVFEYNENGKNTRVSPAYLWKKIKLIDGYAPEVGTDMRSIFKALQSAGVCAYHMLPNNYDQTLKQYSNPSVINRDMEDDAQLRVIESYAFGTDKSFEGIKKDIYFHKAVVLLIHCDNGFFGTKYPTFTKRPYGHFVLAVGYDKDHIIVLDSTERKYPIKYIHRKYIGFIRETGTAIDASNKLIKELVTKRNLYETIVLLTRKIKSLIK